MQCTHPNLPHIPTTYKFSEMSSNSSPFLLTKVNSRHSATCYKHWSTINKHLCKLYMNRISGLLWARLQGSMAGLLKSTVLDSKFIHTTLASLKNQKRSDQLRHLQHLKSDIPKTQCYSSLCLSLSVSNKWQQSCSYPLTCV